MFIVVQPLSAVIEQVAPVKPFEQMHRHEFAATMLVPPLAQGVDCRQFERSAAALARAVDACWRGSTINITGITMAAAMSRARIIKSRMKAQAGIPQHLLGRFFSSKPDTDMVGEGFLARARFELAKGEGQHDVGRSPPVVGVVRPGGGNEARISDIDPELDRPLAWWNQYVIPLKKGTI